jgi:hypothetical protein
MEEKWAYRTLHTMDVTKGLAEASLAGVEGWELVTVVRPLEMAGYLLILKRRGAVAV